jgi:hypothetical protein
MENDDVADAGVIDQAVGQDSLPYRQGRLHRRTRDSIRLDHEGLKEERKAYCHGDRRDQLKQRFGPGL